MSTTSNLWEAAMALFSFKKKEDVTSVTPEMESFLNGFSIEVMPRTA
ncbi:MAG: methylenetetrahydrofolate reductase, partial [Rhodobacteraceae bacterium]|nr:methylenetetrahydrofolate reductase [Paracoccaceae bacterium]